MDRFFFMQATYVIKYAAQPQDRYLNREEESLSMEILNVAQPI